MNLQQLQALAASVGSDWDANVAAAIAMAESGGNPSALCDSCAGVTEYSVGLFQINTLAWPRWSAAQLYDPTFNAQAAHTIWKTVGGFSPWSTYTSGAYKRWYTPASPASPARNWKRAALIAAAAASVVVLGVVGYQEAKRAGLVGA